MKICRDAHGYVSLGQNYDLDLLKIVEGDIVKVFGGRLVEKLDDLDMSYHDYIINQTPVVVHYEHYTGVYLIPAHFFSDVGVINKQQIERENAMIDALEQHFIKNYEHIKTT